jgi:DNA mismatch repair protein MLH1
LQGGAPSPDISTPSASDTPTTIRLLYGHSIAKELIHHQLSSRRQRNDDEMDQDEDEDPESWTAESYFTNANYQAKKMVFLLFINRTCICLQSPKTYDHATFQIDLLNQFG